MNKSIYGLTLLVAGILYYAKPFVVSHESMDSVHFIEMEDEQTRINVKIVKKFLEYALNKGYVELVDDLVSEHYVGHFTRSINEHNIQSDRDYIKHAIIEMHTICPDYYVRFYKFYVHGSKVNTYWKGAQLVNNLPFMVKLPEYDFIEGSFIFILKDNKIIESKYNFKNSITISRKH